MRLSSPTVVDQWPHSHRMWNATLVAPFGNACCYRSSLRSSEESSVIPPSASLMIVRDSNVRPNPCRSGSLTRREATAVVAQFDADCAAGIWTFIPVNAAILQRVCEAFASLPVSTALRAADAIHCASAAAYGVDRIYSNDRHLLDASSHFNLIGVNVTAP